MTAAQRSAREKSASLSDRIEKMIAPLRDAVDEERFPATIVRRLVEGENPLRVYREHRGLTQAALAKTAGTDPQYISQIERGARQPGRKLLARLAKALNVDEEDLR